MRKWTYVLLAAGLLAAVTAAPRAEEPPPPDQPRLLELSRTHPRQAAEEGRRNRAEAATVARLDETAEKLFASRLGKERAVAVDTTKMSFRLLPPDEQREQLRDWALLAAYSQMDPDPEIAKSTLGSRPSVRQPHLAGLLDFEVGPGRIAPLGEDDYLVVLPEQAGEEGKASYDVRTLCRLVDERACTDGRRPAWVRVVTYKHDLKGPSLAITYRKTISGDDLYGVKGDFGFVSERVKDVDGLKKFLDGDGGVVDLLQVTPEQGGLRLEGRRYPRTGPDDTRKYRPIDLDDLTVLYRSVFETTSARRAELMLRSRQAGFKDLPAEEREKRVKELADDLDVEVWLRPEARPSSVGFSLDPWIESKPVADALRRYRKATEKDSPLPETFAKALDATLEQLDKHDAFPAPASLERDEIGLFRLVNDLRTEVEKSAGKKAKDDAEAKAVGRLQLNLMYLQSIADAAFRDHEFSAARYEGEIEGTEVGMTLFYCDAVAKVCAWGKLRGHGPVKGLPRVEGFKTWEQIDASGLQLDDLRRTHKGRLWWGLKLPGVVHESAARPERLTFAPAAVRIFFRIQQGAFAKEEEPNVVWATFADSWNRRYLAVADQEPEFHRLNEIIKWTSALEWSKSRRDTSWAFLAGEKPKPAGLRFPVWYADAMKAKQVGADVPWGFKTIKSVATEALADQISETYTVAGIEPMGWRGGVSGPRAEEIGRRKSESLRPIGLPADVDVKGWKGPEAGGKVQIDLLDGRVFRRAAGRDAAAELESKRGATLQTTSYSWRPAGEPQRVSHETRVDLDAAEGSLRVRTRLSYSGKTSDLGPVTVRPDKDGSLRLDWKPSPTEDPQLTLRTLATGADLDPALAPEVRHDAKSGLLYVKLAGEDTWLEARPGGGGKEPPGLFPPAAPPSPPDLPGSFRVGVPGRPDYVAGVVVERKITFPILEPGQRPYEKVVLERKLVGSKLKSTGVWFRSGEALALKFGNQDTSVAYARDGGLEASRGPLADFIKGLSVADFTRFRDLIEEEILPFGGFYRERGLKDGAYLVVKAESGWELLSRKEAEARPDRPLLAELPEGKKAVLRDVAAEGGLAPDTLRIIDDTLLHSKAMTPEARLEAQKVLKSLQESPYLLPEARGYARLTAEALKELKVKRDQLDKPVKIGAQVTDGKLVIADAAGKPLDVRAAKVAKSTGQPLPPEWAALKGQTCLFDVRGLPPEKVMELQQLLGELEESLGARLIAFQADEKSPERLKALRAPRKVAVSFDEGSLEKVANGGKLAIDALREIQEGTDFFDSTMLVELAHFDKDGEALGRLKKRFESGAVDGKDVVVLICNKDPAQLLQIRDLALKHGAKSFAFAHGGMDVRAATCMMLMLDEGTHYREGATPIEMIQGGGYAKAAKALEKCKGEEDPAAAIRDTFGPSVHKMFLNKEGQLDMRIVDDILKRLQTDPKRVKQHVDRGNAARPGERMARRPRVPDGRQAA